MADLECGRWCAERLICTVSLVGVNAKCTKVPHETTRCEVLLPFDAVPGQPETQQSTDPSLVSMVHRRELQALHGDSMWTEPYGMMELCSEVLDNRMAIMTTEEGGRWVHTC